MGRDRGGIGKDWRIDKKGSGMDKDGSGMDKEGVAGCG